MRVLVCGGRDYFDRALVFATLDDLRQQHGPLTVIQGGASGADQWAREWYEERGRIHHPYPNSPSSTLVTCPAQWKALGRRAGPIRNQQMIDDYKPDLVLAFPGGNGTADMVRRAEAAGVPVRRIGT